MYYVIHARKLVLLLIILVLIGVTFWAGFLPDLETADTSGDLDFEGEPVVEVFAETPRTVRELESGVVVTVAPVPTKFVEYRIDRERARSQQLDLIQSMIDNQELSESQKEDLHLEMVNLLSNNVKETEIENLLKVNGYLDAVVLLENQSATIVVPVTLTIAEVETIGELVSRITNIRLDKITIIDELTRS